LERLAWAVFALALATIVYLYGAASMRFDLFPAPVVKEAWLAGRAWVEAMTGEEALTGSLHDDDAMESPVDHAAEAAARPAGEELLLIAGGPYRLMSHCPELGCIAWLMDRKGEIRHVWPMDPSIAWDTEQEISGFAGADNIYPVGLHLFDNGDLLASFQGENTFPYGIGLARFDKAGELLWKTEGYVHHWLDVDGEGLVYVPGHRLVESPIVLAEENRLVCEDTRIYDDTVIIVRPDGTVAEEFSLIEALIESDMAGLLTLARDHCDPLHLNHVRPLRPAEAAAFPAFEAGDLLVSLLGVNTVAVLDRETKRVKWSSTGKMMAQHNAQYFKDNQIILLDNRGAGLDKGSRILTIAVEDEESEIVFPKDGPDGDIYTDAGGHFDLNDARTRMLLSLTFQGRVLEIDLDSGEILWEYATSHDVGDYKEANDLEGSPYVRFIANGAYYAGTPSFLEAPSSVTQRAD